MGLAFCSLYCQERTPNQACIDRYGMPCSRRRQKSGFAKALDKLKSLFKLMNRKKKTSKSNSARGSFDLPCVLIQTLSRFAAKEAYRFLQGLGETESLSPGEGVGLSEACGPVPSVRRGTAAREKGHGRLESEGVSLLRIQC